MGEVLCSVGLDVGTTSTQMVVSQLEIENQAGGFAVPEMKITDRKLLYRSPVHFTPMLSESRIDGEKLRELIEEEYRKAGITRDSIQTGAVIITGETSRKENAGAVLENLSHLAGDFVVATAGPDLESRLAAMGSGAVDHSRETGKTVLHMDIGGGTSNLALIREGEILETGCLNVGGRLIRYDGENRISYVSPALKGLTDWKPGDLFTIEEGKKLACKLAEILEMAAGLREPEPCLQTMVTLEGRLLDPGLLDGTAVISFSGGVADCIEHRVEPGAFGDLGPLLGQAIRQSLLCRGEYMLGRETIRATVIGAGCYSTQLSGSTVLCRNVVFPKKNLPAVEIFPDRGNLPQAVDQALSRQEGAVMVLKGNLPGSYEGIRELARQIGQGVGKRPCYLCLSQDLGKALGQALALVLPPGAELLCLDRVVLGENSFLDVGTPVGPAVPVVVKTLVLGNMG